MDYSDFIVNRAQHMRQLEYDLSDNFNELVRYLHDIGVLDNVPVGTLGPSEILTTDDAYAAPPMGLEVYGASTQDGTPTPDAPVEIQSVDDLSLEVRGKNLWGGEKLKIDVLSRTSASVTGEDANGPYVLYYLGDNSGKTICTGPFKENTRYTFLLYVMRANTTSLNVNMGVRYTDGTTASLQRTTPPDANTPSYTNFVSAAGKTVKEVYIVNHGGTTRLYYDKCGVFEGVYALADFVPYIGTTVPNLLPEGTSLRSLPDGTRDELRLSYLRPSEREGWAWYERELVRRTGITTIGELTGWNTPTVGGHTVFRAYRPFGHDNTSGAAFCSAFGVVTIGPANMLDNSINVNSGYWSAGHHLAIRCDSCATVADLLELVGNAPLIYALATPTTTQLDPIELPVLPAPDCTVWCDGGSAQPTIVLEYVRDTNAAIADLSEAIADVVSD